MLLWRFRSVESVLGRPDAALGRIASALGGFVRDRDSLTGLPCRPDTSPARCGRRHRSVRRSRGELGDLSSLEELDLAQYFAKNNVYQIDMSVSHSAARAAGSSISSATRRRAFYTYRMAAGGAAMHHPLTPHRSSPNTSTRDRCVIILRFMASGDHDPPAYALHWAGRSKVTLKGAQACPVHACTASR